MTEQKLCWRCREYLEKKYGANFYMAPSNHCHHSDPEQKPKEKCWCDDPAFQSIYLGGELREIHFCPICGKLRKDWGK